MGRSIRALLDERPRLIGVLHAPPLPGASRSSDSVEQIVERVVADARSYRDGGVDALLVENFGDAPFHATQVEPQVLTCMTRVALEVARAVDLPFGVNVLRNDARGGLAVAMASGACFIRVNVLAGSVATDQGIIEGCASMLARERRRLEPSSGTVAIFADVDVKHGRQLWGDSIEARAADLAGRSGADVLIVTGSATGQGATAADVGAVVRAVDTPVLIGSGVTPDTVLDVLPGTRGAIVGTWAKEDGDIARPVEVGRVEQLVRAARQAWGE